MCQVATPSETDKPFALALDDAKLDESGRMLTTEKGSFKRQSTSEIWNEKTFYVRECYQQIADLMFQKNPPAMSLLGSSGIGKSNFMIYLIWRRFQDPELSKFPVFLRQKNRITQFKKGEMPKKVNADTVGSAPRQALYIMDADNQYECYVDCQSLWITSARKSESPAFNTEHFKHAVRASGQFFLPPWTLAEMLDDKDKTVPKVKLRAGRLTTGGTQSDSTVKITGGLDGVLISGNPKPVIEAGKYYQPTSKNFPAFGSWTSQGLFQMTVAPTHKIIFPTKGQGLQASKVAVEAGKKHGGKAKFYFVVPSFRFDGGWDKMQKVDNSEMKDQIEQWVVCFEENLPK
eukprot:Skav207641  [mRNA]  locus=scaffold1172:217788:219233:+ [translate_table: standard]